MPRMLATLCLLISPKLSFNSPFTIICEIPETSRSVINDILPNFLRSSIHPPNTTSFPISSDVNSAMSCVFTKTIFLPTFYVQIQSQCQGFGRF